MGTIFSRLCDSIDLVEYYFIDRDAVNIEYRPEILLLRYVGFNIEVTEIEAPDGHKKLGPMKSGWCRVLNQCHVRCLTR
jgi:hypothetical protein